MSKRRHDTFAEHYADSFKSSGSEPKHDLKLHDRERAADPMLEYLRQKEREKRGNTNTKPIYKGPYPANRFNIRPGHKWDGVDRSNGYEKKLIERESAKKAKEEDSYRYATRDL